MKAFVIAAGLGLATVGFARDSGSQYPEIGPQFEGGQVCSALEDDVVGKAYERPDVEPESIPKHCRKGSFQAVQHGADQPVVDRQPL